MGHALDGKFKSEDINQLFYFLHNHCERISCYNLFEMQNNKIRILSALFFFIGLVVLVNYRDKRASAAIKDLKMAFCESEANCKIVTLISANGAIDLMADTKKLYGFYVSHNVAGNENNYQNFIDKVKPGDKFIKKANADNFITVRGTDTLTWHIDCPY